MNNPDETALSGEPPVSDECYNRTVDECADEGRNQIISNALPEHARYLMSRMLRKARSRIRLYSGSLEQSVQSPQGCGTAAPAPVRVYADPDLLAAVEEFLRVEGHALSILVQKDVDGGVEDHPLVCLVQDLKARGDLRGSFELKRLNGEQAKINNHFMVMDDTAYRFELDHNPCRAQANFGDSKTAQALADLFDNFLLPAATALNVESAAA